MKPKLIDRDIRILNYRVPLITLCWFAAVLVTILVQLSRVNQAINNYYIFKHVFYHLKDHRHLYLEYPGEHWDSNHYGPVFGLIIAPFALLPDMAGVVLWVLLNAAFLLWAVRVLPLPAHRQNIILLILLNEIIANTQSVQSNALIAAWVILAYVFTTRQKYFLATLFIALGLFVKIYGIVGLAFFFISKDKFRFCAYFLLNCLILFLAPMLIGGASFVMQSYGDWYQSLQYKHAINADSLMQGFSIMRFFNRALHIVAADICFFSAAGFLLLLPLTVKKLYTETALQLQYLALLLMSIVIFSSSAESATYIIAMAGVAIWYAALETKTVAAGLLLVACLVLTSFSTTDLFSNSFKNNYIRFYALKALPVFLTWLYIIYTMCLASPFFKLLNNKYENKYSNTGI